MQPISGALRFCDVPGGDTFTETEFYNEFFVPFDLRYQMVIQLPAPPDVIVGYALNRSADEVRSLLPTSLDLGRESITCEATIDSTRWRCVIHPVPVGPTVLLLRPLGDLVDEAIPLIDLGLTPRQTDVAVALARTGGTNAQLAHSMQVSEGTVKKHLEAVFRTLGVDSRASAIVAIRAANGGNDVG